ncbi:hypothetical protein CALCODRAFT_500413 [Calocera cornea HHB12733]|uniref:RING-type domain-containing protein n=1 Tax=Calocera cornea HHB12733 TaxID=1353952 RepID=A0A165E2H9_9BASI|nr:hypothetical protein CALCODRAFT_500413 [Calocera cornea HHB12733]
MPARTVPAEVDMDHAEDEIQVIGERTGNKRAHSLDGSDDEPSLPRKRVRAFRHSLTTAASDVRSALVTAIGTIDHLSTALRSSETERLATAGNSAAITALTTLLECGLCYELLAQPYVMACGHTSCGTCLAETWKSKVRGVGEPERLEDREKRCPYCDKVVRFRPVVNWTVKALVESAEGKAILDLAGLQKLGQEDNAPADELWEGIFVPDPPVNAVQEDQPGPPRNHPRGRMVAAPPPPAPRYPIPPAPVPAHHVRAPQPLPQIPPPQAPLNVSAEFLQYMQHPNALPQDVGLRFLLQPAHPPEGLRQPGAVPAAPYGPARYLRDRPIPPPRPQPPHPPQERTPQDHQAVQVGMTLLAEQRRGQRELNPLERQVVSNAVSIINRENRARFGRQAAIFAQPAAGNGQPVVPRFAHGQIPQQGAPQAAPAQEQQPLHADAVRAEVQAQIDQHVERLRLVPEAQHGIHRQREAQHQPMPNAMRISVQVTQRERAREEEEEFQLNARLGQQYQQQAQQAQQQVQQQRQQAAWRMHQLDQQPQAVAGPSRPRVAIPPGPIKRQTAPPSPINRRAEAAEPGPAARFPIPDAALDVDADVVPRSDALNQVRLPQDNAHPALPEMGEAEVIDWVEQTDEILEEIFGNW